MKTTPRSFFLFIAVAIANTIFVCPALAGRYELIESKGTEVCEAHKNNLESFDQELSEKVSS